VLVPSRPDSIQSAIVGSAGDERCDLAFTTTANIYSETQARIDPQAELYGPSSAGLGSNHT